MQPVNFLCGHCQNLMAVGAEFLGQQVRCPHCQQVVVAPPPDYTPAQAPPPPVGQAGSLDLTVSRPVEDHDSIFAPPPVSDDLFGIAEMPRIEIPAGQPSWMQEAMAQQPAAVPPPPSVDPPTEVVGVIATSDLPTIAEHPGTPAAAESTLSDATELLPSVPRHAAYRQSNSSIWMFVALICLVSYSILATIKIADFYMQLNQQIHPLEMMPDTDPNVDKGVKKAGKQSVVPTERFKPTILLPARLITKLGQALTIGDVQVTPEKVELKKVRIFAKGGRTELGQKDSLVLQLRMKNVSSDLVFSPTDRFFDRRISPKAQERLPYTFLEFDGKRFFSGLDTLGNRQPKEHAEGQKYGEHLQPGEELTTVVCTDPDVDIAGELAKFSGTLLWRVQVRRGIVEYKDKEYPTTAVVGVEFTKQDITKQDIQKRDVKEETE